MQNTDFDPDFISESPYFNELQFRKIVMVAGVILLISFVFPIYADGKLIVPNILRLQSSESDKYDFIAKQSKIYFLLPLILGLVYLIAPSLMKGRQLLISGTLVPVFMMFFIALKPAAFIYMDNANLPYATVLWILLISVTLMYVGNKNLTDPKTARVSNMLAGIGGVFFILLLFLSVDYDTGSRNGYKTSITFLEIPFKLFEADMFFSGIMYIVAIGLGLTVSIRSIYNLIKPVRFYESYADANINYLIWSLFCLFIGTVIGFMIDLVIKMPEIFKDHVAEVFLALLLAGFKVLLNFLPHFVLGVMAISIAYRFFMNEGFEFSPPNREKKDGQNGQAGF